MSDGGFGVILAAAGSGTRFGGRKQLVELGGRTVLLHSLDRFAAIPGIVEIVVVSAAEDLPDVSALVDGWTSEPARRADRSASGPVTRVVPGGARRQDSVRLGLETLGHAIEHVLVHDAARPLVTRADIERTMAAVRECGAAAIGHPVTDSVKEERGGAVFRSLDRTRIWQVQTPQGARRDLLVRAYSSPDSALHTDEVSLLEAAGIEVRLVQGSRDNIKITHPEDLAVAELYLGRRGARDGG